MPLLDTIAALTAQLQQRMSGNGFMSPDDMDTFLKEIGAASIASTRQDMVEQGASDEDIEQCLSCVAAMMDDWRQQVVAQFKSFCVRQRKRMH